MGMCGAVYAILSGNGADILQRFVADADAVRYHGGDDYTRYRGSLVYRYSSWALMSVKASMKQAAYDRQYY
jgi:hypothetical protein